MHIAIIGAGIAGLACAEALSASGHAVAVFDKGRAPGGRMSTRRITTANGEASFDHGAQYFTVRDPTFRARVDRWNGAGLAQPWPAAGPDAWVGTPAMAAPIAETAAAYDIPWGTAIDRIGRDAEGWRIADAHFDAVLIATPAEQAAPLLFPWHPAFASRAAATPSDPCWTLMAAFPDRLPIGPDILREAGAIGWAARNSAKPGRAGPEAWVVQAAPTWSRAHLEEQPEHVASLLLDALAERTGAALPPPLTITAHRWRYARSGVAGEGALWDPALRLGACGDWLLGPRVEAAFLSGTRLANAIS